MPALSPEVKVTGRTFAAVIIHAAKIATAAHCGAAGSSTPAYQEWTSFERHAEGVLMTSNQHRITPRWRPVAARHWLPRWIFALGERPHRCAARGWCASLHRKRPRRQPGRTETSCWPRSPETGLTDSCD
jgi:hypothetical protein